MIIDGTIIPSLQIASPNALENQGAEVMEVETFPNFPWRGAQSEDARTTLAHQRATEALLEAAHRGRAPADEDGAKASVDYVSHLIEDPIVQTLMAAAATFQKLEVGTLWLLTPSPSLGNQTPASLISTQAGRELVANELGLIEHGMF